MTIKVSIVEDNANLRETLASLFNGAPGLQCVSAHGTGEEAARDLPPAHPDVALVDIHLPGISGIECVARLKAQLPKLQVLMLTRFEQNDLIFNSIRAGASGYLLKNTPRAELIQAVEQVHAGGAPMTMQIARKVMDHFRKIQLPAAEMEKLTPREQEVLSLLAKGYLYKQIGDELGISINTMRNRLRAIYEKLHVHSRTEATVKFLGRD
jgi:DNA-binding NarL/FixJ family response regulator